MTPNISEVRTDRQLIRYSPVKLRFQSVRKKVSGAISEDTKLFTSSLYVFLRAFAITTAILLFLFHTYSFLATYLGIPEEKGMREVIVLICTMFSTYAVWAIYWYKKDQLK